MESIVTIHSEYYELFIKDDSIYLMTYAFIVKKIIEVLQGCVYIDNN